MAKYIYRTRRQKVMAVLFTGTNRYEIEKLFGSGYRVMPRNSLHDTYYLVDNYEKDGFCLVFHKGDYIVRTKNESFYAIDKNLFEDFFEPTKAHDIV